MTCSSVSSLSKQTRLKRTQAKRDMLHLPFWIVVVKGLKLIYVSTAENYWVIHSKPSLSSFKLPAVDRTGERSRSRSGTSSLRNLPPAAPTVYNVLGRFNSSSCWRCWVSRKSSLSRKCERSFWFWRHQQSVSHLDVNSNCRPVNTACYCFTNLSIVNHRRNHFTNIVTCSWQMHEICMNSSLLICGSCFTPTQNMPVGIGNQRSGQTSFTKQWTEPTENWNAPISAFCSFGFP